MPTHKYPGAKNAPIFKSTTITPKKLFDYIERSLMNKKLSQQLLWYIRTPSCGITYLHLYIGDLHSWDNDSIQAVALDCSMLPR